MFDHFTKGGYESYDTVELAMEPRPGMTRIYIYDDFPGLGPYTMPTCIPKDTRWLACRPSWLKELKAALRRNDK
jgi:hypothetical protein